MCAAGGTSKASSSHSEAGGGAVKTQVRRVDPGLRARDYGFIARPEAAAATAAASQGAKENEINTAKRLLKIGFAPVDLLYSESLTKRYQKVGRKIGHSNQQLIAAQERRPERGRGHVLSWVGLTALVNSPAI